MGFDDIFISYFDTSGSFRWVKQLGDINDEAGVVMAMDPGMGGPGTPIIAGWFNSASLNFGGWHLLNPAMLPALFVAKPDYTILGADEQNRNDALKVYPVPASDILNIAGPDAIAFQELVLKIIDVQGRTVYENNVQAEGKNLEQINVSGLSPGIYLLQANGRETYIARFSIVR